MKFRYNYLIKKLIMCLLINLFQFEINIISSSF